MVAGVIRAAREQLPSARIVVVDDGSTDQTAAEATSAGASVLNLPFNCGYGVAFQTGLLYAERAGAEYVVTMDADGQHEPADLQRLIDPLVAGQADIVLGSRYLPGSRSYKIPMVRRGVSWLLAKILSLLTGDSITDTTTGFQALNRRGLAVYTAMRDFPEKTPDADLLFYAHSEGCRLLEIPVTMHEDITGMSMHGLLKSAFYLPNMFVSLLGILIGRQLFRSRKQRALLQP